MALLSLMTEHPQSVGESYGQHLRFAMGFAGWLFLAAGAAAIHAVLPFLFQHTASTILRRLCDRVARR
jgi:hypothetical protein